MSAQRALNRARGIKVLKAAFLLALFRNPHVPMTPSDIDEFWIQLDIDLIPEIDREVALRDLEEDGLIEFGGSRQSEISITDSGLTEVRVQSADRQTFLGQCKRGGERWLRSILEEIYGPLLEGRLTLLPGSPTDELDITSQPHLQRELINKLDRLVDAIRSNNSFRTTDPQNYEVVAQSLNKLSHEVAVGKTTVSKLETMGFGALSFIALKFADTVIGTLATDIWNLITHLVHMLT